MTQATKVPEAPATKELAVVDNSGNSNVESLVDKVRVFDEDIARFERHIHVLKEQLEEMVEALPIYQQVKEAADRLKQLQSELKRELMSVASYNNLAEELAEEKESLKDAKANISDFLLGFFAETKERQIELAQGDAREVKLKASLGKEQPFQTNIFRAED